MPNSKIFDEAMHQLGEGGRSISVNSLMHGVRMYQRGIWTQTQASALYALDIEDWTVISTWLTHLGYVSDPVEKRSAGRDVIDALEAAQSDDANVTGLRDEATFLALVESICASYTSYTPPA